MLKASVNRLAINSGNVPGLVSYLPPSTADVEFLLFERISPFLSGTTEMGIDMLGDISKVIPLVAPPIEKEISTTGDLTKTQIVFLPSASSTKEIEPTGYMSTLLFLPNAEANFGLDMTGEMIATSFSSGSSDKAIELTGSLISQVEIPAGESTKSFGFSDTNISSITSVSGLIEKSISTTGYLTLGKVNAFNASAANVVIELIGNLTSTQRLEGTIVMSIETTANISTIRSLDGTSVKSMETEGYLSNNAFGSDISEKTMTRPKTKREMIR